MIDYAAVERRLNAADEPCFRPDPFPHYVWDGILPAETLRAAAQAFPDTSAMTAKPGIPRWHSQDRGLAGPALRELCEALLGDDLAAFLGKVTGVEGLRTEPDGDWGSYRLAGHGAVHHAHVGSNRHPETGRLRRYSLFTYLSEGWRPEDGGWLELGEPVHGRSPVRILPSFGRSVLIETTARSLHGVSAVHAPAPVTRRTVTVHFWTDPAEDGAA
ncbi:2OG-Fe(II) oxygenase [Streptomyces rhizosphaerihabitans]|uniref:2OG-Fe(II) oxygenase n=1 Tax=Streptomyces rhizosphaerihabitans TaxID=1266770 RepID=UPI0021C180FA|nr:2OG-Fe(II) oxygenase [Streptomyces rhizosphaerihabitans]MCT9007409.1 2OG-Fe(II) oxygenase [Streptomyces rhizosphaerihabitans]